MSATLAIVLVVFLVLFFLAICFALYVWWKKSIYTRERFAFAGLAILSSLVLFMLTTLYVQQTPWMALMTLVTRYWSVSPQVSTKPLTLEQGILSVLLVWFVGWFILLLHRHWDGATSIDQYRREQRSEPTGVFAEGFYEIRRIAQGQPLPSHHVRLDPRDFIAQLEPVTDSLAWKDQARELIRLSSPSYAFDAEAGWYDLASLWVGKNLDTNDLAFLHPATKVPNKPSSGKSVGELRLG